MSDDLVLIGASIRVPVDDLHAAIEAGGRGSLLTQDGVHFTPEGSRLLGQTVADFVRPPLTSA